MRKEWKDIIGSVKTPLSFFTLAILVADSALFYSLVKGNLSELVRVVTIICLTSITGITIIIVALIIVINGDGLVSNKLTHNSERYKKLKRNIKQMRDLLTIISINGKKASERKNNSKL